MSEVAKTPTRGPVVSRAIELIEEDKFSAALAHLSSNPDETQICANHAEVANFLYNKK